MKIKSEDLEKLHKPVLVEEVMKLLGLHDTNLRSGSKYIDATLGLGGHSLNFLKKNVSVLGIDADPESLEIAESRLKVACPTLNKNVQGPNFIPALGNFRDIDKIARANNFEGVSGILMDLGISSYQLDFGKRGFSFTETGDLDMRLDPSASGVKASDLLNALNRGALIALFDRVLENTKESKRIADSVISYRQSKLFSSVDEFVELVNGVGFKSRKWEPATLPFLALRIAVNSEIDNLEEALPKAFSLLSRNGRLGVISFHSLEDSLVKSFMKGKNESGEGKILTKKPIRPSDDEVYQNPRARSAKLRVIEKI